MEELQEVYFPRSCKENMKEVYIPKRFAEKISEILVFVGFNRPIGLMEGAIFIFF